MEHSVTKLNAPEADLVTLEDLVTRSEPRLPGQPPGLGGLDEDTRLLRWTLNTITRLVSLETVMIYSGPINDL